MGIDVKIQKVIKGIGDNGTTGNVMDILALLSSDFQIGFDLAVEMQNRDLVKLLYSNFNQNKIILEFTLLGRAAYKQDL
jgi:hypothetical protein